MSTARRTTRKSKPRGVRVPAQKLGRVLLVEYERDGKRWRHEFKKSTDLGFVKALSALVIPATLTRGRFIAD